MHKLNIWVEQDKLNKVCSLQTPQIGTIEAGLVLTDEEREARLFDFKLAFFSEYVELVKNYTWDTKNSEIGYILRTLVSCSENLDDYIWKHWSKEAREGKRFTRIAANRDGEAKLLTHIKSLFKYYGVEKTWSKHYSPNFTLLSGQDACHLYLDIVRNIIAIQRSTVRMVRRELFKELALLASKLTCTQIHTLPEGTYKDMELVSHKEEGEGTMQNVKLELTDMLFFTVSILHLIPETEEFWESKWTQHQWPNTIQNNTQLIQNATTLLLNVLSPALGRAPRAITQVSTKAIITLMRSLFAGVGCTRELTESLYQQKLDVNYTRIRRGRKQVNDELADIENAAIK